MAIFNGKPTSPQINPKCNVFKFRTIELNEIASDLTSIKVSKSAGPDNLPAQLIRDGGEQIAAILYFLVNQSLRSGSFPNSEKHARLTPIHKSGEKSNFDNYRPTYVLNVLAKVLEKLVHRQLSDYLERNNLLSCSQFGFRGERSTQHAVTLFTEHIRNNMEQSRCTGALFMDLRKAFGTVHHGTLLDKLRCYGIQNTELAWFEDYLFNRKQFACYDQSTSQPEQITYGVPRGSILGPLLFINLINDVHLVLDKCKILMYAYDSVIFFSERSVAAVEEVLNQEAKLVGKWFTNNNLILNLQKGKTELVIYGTGQKLAKQPSCNVSLHGTPIKQATSYEYLGITLDNHLTMSMQIDKIYKRASNWVKLLQRICPNISPLVAEKIYSVMIRPVLFYCYPVYLCVGESARKKLQSIQDRAHKIIAPTKITLLMMDTLDQIRKKRVSIDVFKSLNDSCPPPLRKMFERFDHGKDTRGNGSRLVLPKVKTEAGRKTFAFQGALIFNGLPTDLMNEPYFVNFKRKKDTLSFV